MKRLIEKRNLLLQGDPAHKKIRTVLMVLSGGMRGASAGGICVAFHALGLNNVFDVALGFSTGAPMGGYFLAGPEQTRLGTSIYYIELPPRFIRYSRSPVADIDYLESLFRTGSKALDVSAVMKHRSQFYIAVTKTPSGEPVLLNAKLVPDMVTALKATTAMPGLYGKSVTIEGVPYVDGALGNPFPVQAVIERFNPTDLLVIANRPHRTGQSDKLSRIESVLARLMLRNEPEAIKLATLNRRKRYQDGMRQLEQSTGLNWGILYSPDDGTHLLTRDPKKLRKLAVDSAQIALSAFGQPDLQIDLL